MFDLDTLFVNGQAVTVEDHAEGFYRVVEAPKDPGVWRGIFTQLREVWPVRVDAATASWLHANWFREPGMYRVDTPLLCPESAMRIDPDDLP